MNKVLTFVLKNSLGDCTNNGLTSKKDSLYLYSKITESNREQLDELEEDVLILIERTLFGKQSNYAVPYSIFKSGRQSMAGGNFVYTSDSRFPSAAPISVHDRLEN